MARNKKLNDLRFVTLLLNPFQTVRRIDDDFQIRFLRLSYDMLNLQVTAEVQGVLLGPDGKPVNSRLRKLAFRDSKKFPLWMTELAEKHTPREFVEYQKEAQEVVKEARRQQAALTRREILDAWTAKRAGVAS